MCPGDVHLAVLDISRVYRQFHVSPNDWPLLGIRFYDAYFFYKRIPFGCRMSSFVMQSVAEFIDRALATRHVKAHMYLDDIVIVAPTKPLADQHYKQTIDLLTALGLQVVQKKL